MHFFFLVSHCSEEKKLIQKQMAFMLARQQIYLELDENMDEYDELVEIMSNAHLNNNFLSLAREVRTIPEETSVETRKFATVKYQPSAFSPNSPALISTFFKNLRHVSETKTYFTSSPWLPNLPLSVLQSCLFHLSSTTYMHRLKCITNATIDARCLQSIK